MSGAIPSDGLGMLSEAPQTLLQDVEATLRLASQVEDAAKHVARNLGDRSVLPHHTGSRRHQHVNVC
jgi:hypothetical protein